MPKLLPCAPGALLASMAMASGSQTWARDLLSGLGELPGMLQEVSDSMGDVVGLARAVLAGRRPWSSVEQSKPLKSFCSVDLGHASSVLSCMCCISHLLGDQVSQAGLLYGSGPVKAPAWVRHHNGSIPSFAGWAPTWSLGGRIPSIWCDRGYPVCFCEDSSMEWHEEGAACEAGGFCVPAAPAPEEGVSPHGRDTAQARRDSRPREHPDCDAGRVSLGSARCEDMSVAQCDRLYRQSSDGTWQHCQVNQHAVRECGAHAVDGAEVEKLVAQAQSWAVQYTYTPESDWPTEIQPDQTWRLSREHAPGADEVQKLFKIDGGERTT